MIVVLTLGILTIFGAFSVSITYGIISIPVVYAITGVSAILSVRRPDELPDKTLSFKQMCVVFFKWPVLLYESRKYWDWRDRKDKRGD